MLEILEQLRTDLMTAIYQYQQLFNDRPIPDIRRQDIARLIPIIHDESHETYYDCINAVEEYIAGIKTLWWPFHKKSRLRDNLQTIMDDYRHPEIHMLIRRIDTQKMYLNFQEWESTEEQLSIFSQWITYLLEKVELIRTLQNTLISIKKEKSKQQKIASHCCDRSQYLVKHPANECL